MPRNWIFLPGVENPAEIYPDAVAHIKLKRPNQTKLQNIGPSHTSMNMRECEDGGPYIGLDYYNQTEVIRYYKSGVVALDNIEGTWVKRWGYGLADVVLYFTGAHTRIKSGQNQIMTSKKGPPKIQKCRKCGGYTWQGKETEDILLELITNRDPRFQDPGWNGYGLAPRERKEYYQHQFPCQQCGGSGRFDYGSQNVWVPIPHNQLVLIDWVTKDPKGVS